LECFLSILYDFIRIPFNASPSPPSIFLFGFESDRSRQTHAFTKLCQCQRLVSTKASCWAVISVVCATLGEGGGSWGRSWDCLTSKGVPGTHGDKKAPKRMSETLAGTQLAKLQLGEPILECFLSILYDFIRIPLNPSPSPLQFFVWL